MTPTITRCGNGEFLLKFVHEERTMMTFVLSEEEARRLCTDIDAALPHPVCQITVPFSALSEETKRLWGIEEAPND